MIDHHENVRKAHDEDDLMFGTVESWILYVRTLRALDHSYSCLTRLQRLTANGHRLHITDVTNASRTLLMNLNTLEWDPALLKFFEIKPSVLPKIVSSSEVYGELQSTVLKGVKVAGLAGDQQAALIGNKCLRQGEADRKSTRLNSSHSGESRMPSSA